MRSSIMQIQAMNFAKMSSRGGSMIDMKSYKIEQIEALGLMTELESMPEVM